MKYVAALIALLAIAAIAAGALQFAESRRKEILAAAPSGLATLPHPPEQVDPAVQRFTDLAGRMESLKAGAEDARLDYSEEQRSEVVDDILARGDELWAAAQARADSDPSTSLELGWDAAACFLAITRWPDHMMFVPPAAAGQPRTSGFFIDDAPVTVGDFMQFCEQQNWSWPDGASLSSTDTPMAGVAYVDAAAYLASASPSRRLPTAEDLERAFNRAIDRGAVRRFESGESDADESTPDDPESDAPRPTRTAYDQLYIPSERVGMPFWFEWSSSTDNLDSTATPMFGDDVITPGVRFTSSGQLIVSTAEVWRYEWSHDRLGFRGKIEMPRTIAELERFNAGSL